MITTDRTATVTLERQVADRVVGYSHRALDRSPFFSALRRGQVPIGQLRSVFGQYRFWRDQFHTWFGLCLLKSGSCAREAVTTTVQSLAHHVFEEMSDDHAGMYLGLLHRLGVTKDEINTIQKSQTTCDYEQSFLNRFGLGSDNFADAMVALSGRELFASVRNGFLMEHLRGYGVENDIWLTVHEGLELAHFSDTISGFLKPEMTDEDIQPLMQLIEREIDCHVSYWDALWDDARHVAAQA
jgi:hypothetical protein